MLVKKMFNRMSLFFFQGYETTSLTVCFALSMLALYPDIQEKLYLQLVDVQKNESVEENLQKLEYLDMVVKETLRLYPIAALVFRKADDDVLMGAKTGFL